MLKLVRSVVVLSLFGFAVACSGGGAGSDSGDGSTGSPGTKHGTDPETTSECSADFDCLDGSCQCTGTKNNGKTCCDPDDSSCDGKSDNCGDSFCEDCRSTSTHDSGTSTNDASPSKDPPGESCTDQGKECDLDSDCCSNDCDIVEGCQ